MTQLSPRSILPKNQTSHNEKDLSSLLDRLEEESKNEPQLQQFAVKKLANTSWTKLFKGLRFFPRYYHFIKIDILS